MTPVQAIRANCIECSGDSKGEVRKCVIPRCPLYRFRMGRNPNCRPRTGKPTNPPQDPKKPGDS